ncbi:MULTISPECIES: hypothetical protein [Brenneria]|uniref:O-antigen ligase domain-containing protein n=1 Tax=Brenneria nigrifluens DSM 30175 = ATCC 13028 TaxID=1121120 RepID=A0A2U1UX61_9GAMM|nr:MULTISPECIES: hypothetical protein [Brenneria]EHD22406.1 hypothetical protein BrE312_3037 [Brenneria sp. EniD312]PWC26210.1 hypothetical protein DDT54_02535 [Brenneria nigrifluens DSM 30175 = ATCC 13028]QCR05408.1 hypothetical protein EH206_15180 [Brenneria nigrifluens DSM 30175 = ATCC 13028]
MTNFLYCSVFVLFLMPKINIISVGNYNAGIRIDDFIIAIWLFIFLFGYVSNKKNTIRVIDAKYYKFIIFIFIGTCFTLLFSNQGSIIFPFRFLEYFTFFIMGVYLAKKDVYMMGMMKVILYFNIIISLLQSMEIIGGFTVSGYNSDVSSRVIGLTSGPWELGVLLNFLTCYFLSSKQGNSYKIIIFFISLFVIFLSGSRMSFVAQMVVAVAYLLKTSSALGVIKKVMIMAPLFVASVFYLSNSAIAERSVNLFNADNLIELPTTYRATTLLHGNPDWSNFDILGGDVDASWSIRSIKWVYAVKLFLSNPVFIATGVGAGTFGNALDGDWLRMLIECGVVGLILFLSFLSANKKLSLMNYLIFYSFSINMIMIDIYMSYKVMSFMLFIFGYMYIETRKTIQQLTLEK